MYTYLYTVIPIYTHTYIRVYIHACIHTYVRVYCLYSQYIRVTVAVALFLGSTAPSVKFCRSRGDYVNVISLTHCSLPKPEGEALELERKARAESKARAQKYSLVRIAHSDRAWRVCEWLRVSSVCVFA